MFIAGEERFQLRKQTSSPSTPICTITYQRGSIQDAEDAIAAARKPSRLEPMYWDERTCSARPQI